jgi:hypothetical protein
MNGETFIVKGIDKTVRDFALKHKINIRRDWNNDYMILENGTVIYRRKPERKRKWKRN